MLRSKMDVLISTKKIKTTEEPYFLKLGDKLIHLILQFLSLYDLQSLLLTTKYTNHLVKEFFGPELSRFRKFSFSNLQRDCVTNIFSYLDASDLVSCLRLSKQFQEIASSSSLWYKLLQKNKFNLPGHVLESHKILMPVKKIVDLDYYKAHQSILKMIKPSLFENYCCPFCNQIMERCHFNFAELYCLQCDFGMIRSYKAWLDECWWLPPSTPLCPSEGISPLLDQGFLDLPSRPSPPTSPFSSTPTIFPPFSIPYRDKNWQKWIREIVST